MARFDLSLMRGRPGALIAASVIGHAVVFGLLSWRFLDPPTPAAPAAPVILLEIEPRPLLPKERPRATVRPSQPTASAATEPRARREPAPERPAPRQVAPSDAPAPDERLIDPWTLRPIGSGASRPGAAVNGIACRSPALLTPEQRAACDQRFGAASAGAPRIVGTGDAERDSRLARDGARARAAYEARRAPLAGGVGVMGPADCVGSNLGTGCAGAHLSPVPGVDMNQGATTNIRQRSNKLRDQP